MRRAIGAWTAAFLVLAGASTVPGPASAQPADAGTPGGWEAGAEAGVEVPLGILSEVQDLGPMAEGAVGYRVHPRVTLRGTGSVAFLEGSQAPSNGRAMPNLRIWRLHVGADVLLWSPSPRTSVVAEVGVGGATYDTEPYEGTVENPVTGEVELDFNHTWLTTGGRLKVEYAVEPRARVFVAGGGRATVADADETAVFGVFDPRAGSRGTDVLWTLPVSAGVEIRF